MSSPQLTKKGYNRLRAEFDQLSLKERPKVVSGVANAAAEGDRSENAEYIYGKKRLREIDKRLSYLSRLLKRPVVVERAIVKTDVVNFGTKVTVLDEKDQTKVWTIVGDGEALLKERTISVEAPVARALLGKAVGDVAEVELANGTSYFTVVAIDVGDID